MTNKRDEQLWQCIETIRERADGIANAVRREGLFRDEMGMPNVVVERAAALVRSAELLLQVARARYTGPRASQAKVTIPAVVCSFGDELAGKAPATFGPRAERHITDAELERGTRQAQDSGDGSYPDAPYWEEP